MGVAAPLRATSCLAANSWSILETVADALRAEGQPVDIEPGLDPVDADVLFGCGLLTRELIRAGAPLEVLAAPVFPGETEPLYRSMIVARADDDLDLAHAAHAQLGVNEYGSWSGWFAYLYHLHANGRTRPDPARRRVTGGHHQSIRALQEEAIDVACIDSSVWHHHRVETDDLVVIDVTRDWPAPPVSVRAATSSRVRDIVTGIAGMTPTSTATYDEMLAVADRFR